MTATVLAGAAGIGLVLLGLGWLFDAPTIDLIGGSLFLCGALRLAADTLSRGVGR